MVRIGPAPPAPATGGPAPPAPAPDWTSYDWTTAMGVLYLKSCGDKAMGNGDAYVIY